MRTPFLFAGTLSALLAVGLGAFGAHGLKHLVTPEMLEIYKTGVTYQMWHALGLICIALLQQQAPLANKLLCWAGWLLIGGIILFSGSLYLLVLLDAKWLGMITPFGGLAFLAGWLCLVIFARKG